MACAKQGISIKDFATRAIVRDIENYEDELDSQTLGLAKKEISESGVISWGGIRKEIRLG